MSFQTKRTTVDAMEEILNKEIPVLDHGFIRIVDYMGDDSSIVQGARVSYGKGTKHVTQDRGLINHLMRNRHTSPFEMCEIKFHIKLPIFVARQWIRHRTANVNEYSARYSILDKEFYIPKKEHLCEQSDDNKQGRDKKLSLDEAEKSQVRIKKLCEDAYKEYENLLNKNVARELARMVLPVNFYTQWYWKIDLHNLLHFTKLRADHHAQYEIRAYAHVIQDILKKWTPMVYDAFMNYSQKGYSLSEKAINIIKGIIKNEKVNDESISKRELNEIRAKFEI